jgi:hypothetical protein
LRDGHGGDSTRLGTGDELAGELGEFIVNDVLGDLGCLSGTGLTNEDKDLGLVILFKELLPVDIVSKPSVDCA